MTGIIECHKKATAQYELSPINWRAQESTYHLSENFGVGIAGVMGGSFAQTKIETKPLSLLSKPQSFILLGLFYCLSGILRNNTKHFYALRLSLAFGHLLPDTLLEPFYYRGIHTSIFGPPL